VFLQANLYIFVFIQNNPSDLLIFEGIPSVAPRSWFPILLFFAVLLRAYEYLVDTWATWKKSLARKIFLGSLERWTWLSLWVPPLCSFRFAPGSGFLGSDPILGMVTWAIKSFLLALSLWQRICGLIWFLVALLFCPVSDCRVPMYILVSIIAGYSTNLGLRTSVYL